MVGTPFSSAVGGPPSPIISLPAPRCTMRNAQWRIAYRPIVGHRACFAVACPISVVVAVPQMMWRWQAIGPFMLWPAGWMLFGRAGKHRSGVQRSKTASARRSRMKCDAIRSASTQRTFGRLRWTIDSSQPVPSPSIARRPALSERFMVARGREMKGGLPGGAGRGAGPGGREWRERPNGSAAYRPAGGGGDRRGLNRTIHVQRPNEHRQSGVTRRGTGAGTATGLHQGIAYWQNEERRESRRGDRRSLKELGFGDRKH